MKEEIQKTKENVYLDAHAAAVKGGQKVGEKHDFYITLDQLNEILLKACPADCSWQEPYGFVPEAGCPIHDAPSPTGR